MNTPASSKSTSVTLRIPNDILSVIDKRASKSGNRSEVILNIIRKSLDIPIPKISESLERTEILENKVGTLESEVKKIYALLDTKRQSNKKVKGVDEKKNLPIKQKNNTLQLDITEIQEIPLENSIKVIYSSELLTLLREQTNVKWDGAKLRTFRIKNKATEWHNFGNFKFKFKEEDKKAKSQKEKYLWSITSEI